MTVSEMLLAYFWLGGVLGLTVGLARGSVHAGFAAVFVWPWLLGRVFWQGMKELRD